MANKKKVTLTPEQNAKQIQVKRAAFVRVVVPRVNKAVKAIRLIGNCAGPNYVYTSEQTTAIFAALGRGIEGVRDAFAKKVEKTEGFFLSS